MRRTRLRAALLVVVAVTLVGIGFLVRRNVSARRAHTVLDLGADFLPEVAQHIQQFHRVKMENGRTTWEITARDAQYYQESKEIVVREPHMTFFLQRDGRQVHVSGAEGRLLLEGESRSELRTLTLRGSVVVQLDDLQLKTEEATYDRATDLITAPQLVTIHGRTIDVRGQGMELRVGPQQVRLLEAVHTVLRSDAATS
ncbi:MAG TPA: LPS export ABC transporter periplasmic protein LptC [Candidatus Binatia bacterium]|nr:LPS export ABC transporter periplasmic protein LptC [Candidatus Binatia bacterium]